MRVKLPLLRGIPVYFDSEYPGQAEAMGIWPRKYILVGYSFMQLRERVRAAVLFHEYGHCVRLHMEKRSLVVPLMLAWVLIPTIISKLRGRDTDPARFLPKFFLAWTQKQELEADEFAAREGYGHDLAQMIRESRSVSHWCYPSANERIERLMEVSNAQVSA